MKTESDNSPHTPERPNQPVPRKRRGFAAMDPNRVSEIARKGGKAAHAAGTAHEFTADEAREAGRKGGMAPHARRGAQKKRETTPPAALTEMEAEAPPSKRSA